MEYMPGGDFLGLLLREDVLDEEVAQWYIAEMILCIEEAHRMKWIHRDVKPDNFLVSASGHLKISDFGLAFDGHWAHNQSYYTNHRSSLMERLAIKINGDAEDKKEAARSPSTTEKAGKRQMDAEDSAANEGTLNWRNRTERRKMARSVVGTSQYMAPEIILGQAYDGRCDWWSVGVILYECLYGRTPFYCENRQATKEAIVNHRATLGFPQHERWSRPTSENRRWLPPVSTLAIDLMASTITDKETRLSSRLYRAHEFRPNRLRHSPSSLGSGRYVWANSAEEIKAHPFFHGIDWASMHRRSPPFVPRFRENQSITKYFEDENDILASETSSSSSSSSSSARSSYGAAVAALDVDVLPEPDLQHALGKHYPRFRASALAQEKAELGMQACTDEDFLRVKTHTGKLWETWKVNRMLEVQAAESARDPPLMPATGIPADTYASRCHFEINGSPPSAGADLVAAAKGEKKNTKKMKREKKKPRDKALRDPVLAKTVLELRKKGAFLGYTYRRIKPCWPELESLAGARGRGMERPTILPVESA